MQNNTANLKKAVVSEGAAAFFVCACRTISKMPAMVFQNFPIRWWYDVAEKWKRRQEMIDIVSGPVRDLKNIRQIGTPAEGDRIYIENSAYARIHEETYEQRRVFIFMGHTECDQGIYTTFVEAAIPVRDMEFAQNLPRWSTHAWSDVFREVKRSYENSIIVGWAMDCRGFPPRLSAELEAIHREQFGGAHQVLFLMDSMEGEEYFYLHRGNHLQQKNGFYIYYARELHEVRTPDVTVEIPRRGCVQTLPDTETRRFLEQPDTGGKQKKSPTSYAMAAAVALLLALVGVGAWQQRIHIPGMEQAVETISRKLHPASGPAEVLVGTQIPSTEPQLTTQEPASTETLSEPLDLIPIEEVPAGEIKKTTDAQTDEETQEADTQKADIQKAESQEDTKEAETQTVEQTQNYYVVKPGDTLSGICKKIYGTMEKLEEIEKANHLDNSDDIREGQKLLLP